jgi:hypothetical protein
MQVLPCLDDPAFSAELRCSVLQVFHSSLFPRSEGLPEELDRGGEMQNHSIFWSSVSAIFRWRPQRGQRDWNLTSLGLTLHALPWQPTGVMTSSYVAFDMKSTASEVPCSLQTCQKLLVVS